MHCEITKNRNASINYCSKPETRVDGPWEFGEIPDHGGDHKSKHKNAHLLSATTEQLADMLNKDEITIY